MLIAQTNKRLEVFIDDCRFKPTDGCYAAALADDDERLNVVNPLQVGGVKRLSNGVEHPILRNKVSFNGCIRNLVVNGDVRVFVQLTSFPSLTFSSMTLSHQKCRPNRGLAAMRVMSAQLNFVRMVNVTRTDQ